MMDKAANKFIELVNEQIRQGVDENGQPFIPYSYGYFIRKNHLKSKARTKQGKLKAMKKFDAAWNAGKHKVNLTLTGNMLSALTPMNVNEPGFTAKIGFANPEAATIAFYHQISGAGRSRVLRKFLGLSQSNMSKFMDYIKGLLERDEENTVANMISKLIPRL